jgi:hypothetical protein
MSAFVPRVLARYLTACAFADRGYSREMRKGGQVTCIEPPVDAFWFSGNHFRQFTCLRRLTGTTPSKDLYIKHAKIVGA